MTAGFNYAYFKTDIIISSILEQRNSCSAVFSTNTFQNFLQISQENTSRFVSYQQMHMCFNIVLVRKGKIYIYIKKKNSGKIILISTALCNCRVIQITKFICAILLNKTKFQFIYADQFPLINQWLLLIVSYHILCIEPLFEQNFRI